MFEHECESEDDCEVYFLKPVNEYNIVDKIKEANRQLFDLDTEDTNTSSSTTFTVANGANNEENGNDSELSSHTIRKVTFAMNLENYEPECNIIAVEFTSEEEEEDENEVKEDKRQVTGNEQQHFPTIDEEPIDDGIEEVVDTEVEQEKNQCEGNGSKSMSGDERPENEITDEIVEEICEEITIMDMEETEPGTESASTVTQQRRMMLKQAATATFDCDDESDNKSLTNLLNSDGEEECVDNELDDNTFDENILDDHDADDDETNSNNDQNNNNNADANNDNDDDDDDTDNLSIIVASYLQDDYTAEHGNCTCNDKRSSGGKKSSYKIPFSKRFTLRRKANSNNSIGATGGDGDGGTNHNRLLIPPPPPAEVLDLKFNYKTCCEYRRSASEQQRLPKYTGYMSEYGLSEEQLQRRQVMLQRKEHFVLEQKLKATQNEMRRMHDNERAFTTWLKNKMRFPINKTKNMFDVKIRRGGESCSGGSSSRNRIGGEKHNK